MLAKWPDTVLCEPVQPNFVLRGSALCQHTLKQYRGGKVDLQRLFVLFSCVCVCVLNKIGLSVLTLGGHG